MTLQLTRDGVIMPSWTPLAPAHGAVRKEAVSEAQLVRVLARHLRREWQPTMFGLEIASHGRSRLDLVVMVQADADHPMLVGIEAKISNWKRAFHQAALNRLVVDASFVALPSLAISPAVLYRGSQLGVGVISVDSGKAIVVLPAEQVKPDPTLREKTRLQLKPVRRKVAGQSRPADKGGEDRA